MFFSLADAQVLIEALPRHYNVVRPHSALGYCPPAPAPSCHALEASLPWASRLPLGARARPSRFWRQPTPYTDLEPGSPIGGGPLSPTDAPKEVALQATHGLSLF